METLKLYTKEVQNQLIKLKIDFDSMFTNLIDETTNLIETFYFTTPEYLNQTQFSNSFEIKKRHQSGFQRQTQNDWKSDENLMYLKRQEAKYDRMFETIHRNEIILSTKDKMKKLILQLETTIDLLYSNLSNDRDKMAEKNNELLEELKSVEQLIQKENSRNKFLQRKQLNDNSFNIKEQNDYNPFIIETMKMKRQKEEQLALQKLKELQEREELERQKRNRLEKFATHLYVHQLIEIENWTGMLFDSLIFDTKIHNWKQKVGNGKACELDIILKDRSNILFVIESEEDQLIGGYISAKIDKINSFIVDPLAFVFKKDETNTLIKYPIRQTDHAFKVFEATDENMFVIGSSDITIRKERKKRECVSFPQSFNYGKYTQRNPLLGEYNDFTLRRMTIYQLYETEEMIEERRKQRELEFKKGTEHLKILSKKMKMNKSPEILQLEKWIGKTYEEIVFDSDVNNWMRMTSEFDTRIMNRNNLVFLIESDDGIYLGGYLSSQITVLEKYIADPNAFVFTFKESNPRMFPIKEKKVEKAFYLFPSLRGGLFEFGSKDLSVLKQTYKSTCLQRGSLSCFVYNDEEDVLLGRTGQDCLIPKRIMVLQFN